MSNHSAAPTVPAEVRTWLYGVAVAVLAVLALYKVIEPEEVPVWTTVVEAILGVTATGTAFAYRPTRPDIRDDGLPIVD